MGSESIMLPHLWSCRAQRLTVYSPSHYTQRLIHGYRITILPHIHLTSEEHWGFKAQLFHFLGKQGIHLTLQGTYSSLAAVKNRTWRQHRGRVQAAQTAKAFTAATVTEQQNFIYITFCGLGANSTIVGGCCLLPTQVGPTVRSETQCWCYCIGEAFSWNAA